MNPPELGTWAEWASFIIAVVALLQVWAIALWKRYRPGQLAIYESGNIELGFSVFGPTISLRGSLRALHREVFVTSAKLRVVRLKDKAESNFSWRFFRPFSVDVSGKEDSTVDPVAGFALTPATSFKYHIFFASDAFVAEFQPSADKVRDEWPTFFSADLATHSPGKTGAQLPTGSVEFEASLGRYLNTAKPTALWAELNHSFFWQSGDYLLELKVSGEKLPKPATKLWRFAIAQTDSDSMRLNAIGILRALSGSSASYNFAYPEYISG
jgi:hypothetical protein